MAIHIENQHISLSVKDLLQPARPPQMLSSFPLPQRGMLGKQAQVEVQDQKRRQHGMFHSEYFLRRSYDYRNYTFTIQGRIDGVYQLKHRVEIEEIKSVILTAQEFRRMQIDRYPEFQEQVLFYAYLLQDELNGMEVGAYIVLLNLVNDARRVFEIPYQRMRIEQLLFQRFAGILTSVEREEEERVKRSKAIEEIRFELPETRPQQQTMMAAVEEALHEAQHLMVSAPTGTGKTAAALYPAIQYAYRHNKKIFFLTSKTTQQNMVGETLQPLIEQGLDIHAVFLRAAEKMCANEVYFCHEAYCPYARDYEERLLESNVLNSMFDEHLITPEYIYRQASARTLCPFEVALDVGAHADIIVGDFNYVFDPAVALKRFFRKKDNADWIILLDEAHNLYERGTQYLSPEIKNETVASLKQQAERRNTRVHRKLAQALGEIARLMDALNLEGEIHFAGRQYFKTDLNYSLWQDVLALYEAAFIKYLIQKIRKRWLIVDDPFESFYFTLRRFVQVGRFQDEAFVPFFNAENRGTLKIQCCDPSAYLGERIDRFHSVVAMSATLDPMPFYRTLLGFPEYRSKELQLDSPFPAEHRKIIIVPNISTRYKDRMNNYPKIAEVIRQTVEAKAGNYLVFFPSFDFVQHVNLFLGRVKYEKIMQKPGMNESDRKAIIERLKQPDQPQLLLAVMGGIFSEGIDYSGDMAIGVIIVSPALPQISYERELQRRYYEQKMQMGMEYAYIFPGMNKVIQSVGRLIRSATDRGVIVLIGERFASDAFNAVFPQYWFEREGDVVITKEIKKEVHGFWKQFDD